MDFEFKNLLILEDDKSYSKLIVQMLDELGIKKVFVANNFEEAVELYNSHSIDFMLVDIYLGENEPTGDEFVRYIQGLGKKPLVLYLTSLFTEENYNKVKDTQLCGFLDKELTKLGLLQAIELAFANNEISRKEEKLVESFSGKNFFFKVGSTYKAIDPDEIVYFYSQNKTTYAKVGDHSFPTTVFLEKLEKGLSSLGFFRIHQSYIVNSKYIKKLILKEHKIQINGEYLPIGESYKKQFVEDLKLFK